MVGKRLFIAINLPEDLKRKLGRVIEQFKRYGDPIKFESAEKSHLTLKFLGYVEENKILNLKSKISEIAKKFVPFELQISGVDYFSDGHFVLYIGLIGQIGVIREISEEIEEEFEKLGFPREKRGFTAHITIGRGKGNQPRFVWKKIGEKYRRVKLPKFEPFLVKSVDLMESELTREGSVYTILEASKFKLQNSN